MPCQTCHTALQTLAPPRGPWSRIVPIAGERPIVSHMNLLRSLIRDRNAVTALEYGIIAGVLGLVLIIIFHRFGTTLSKLFSTIGSSL